MGVYDTRVVEAPGAKLRFTVSLDRRTRRRATVDYATSDGTATAGGDYKATSGTLVFEVSERVELVVVPVLDDVIDEGNETLTLTLSNAQGLVIGDTVGYGLTAGRATGTTEWSKWSHVWSRFSCAACHLRTISSGGTSCPPSSVRQRTRARLNEWSDVPMMTAFTR